MKRRHAAPPPAWDSDERRLENTESMVVEALRKMRTAAARFEEEMRGTDEVDTTEFPRLFDLLAEARVALKTALRNELRPVIEKQRANRRRSPEPVQ